MSVFADPWKTVWQLMAVLVWKPSGKTWKGLYPNSTVPKQVRFNSGLKWHVSKRGEQSSWLFWGKQALFLDLCVLNLTCCHLLPSDAFSLSLETMNRQRADHSKKEQELRDSKAENDSFSAEVKKVLLLCRVSVYSQWVFPHLHVDLWICSEAQRRASKGPADSQRWGGGNEEGGVKVDRWTPPTRRHHHVADQLCIRHQRATSYWSGARRTENSWT